MKQYNLRTLLFSLLSLITLFVLTTTIHVANSAPFDDIQQQIEAAGIYYFTADIEQTLIPRAIPANIGQSEQRIDTRITGQIISPDQAELTLQFEGGGLNIPTFTIEQDGANTYLIQGNERTAIENPLSQTAPHGDYTIYLQAAENIARSSTSEESPFTIYTFDVNGRKLAQHVRDLMQTQLPPAAQPVQVSSSPILQSISGNGELWLDDNGLPRRQILDITTPEINNQYDAQSHIVIDYQFDSETSTITNDTVVQLPYEQSPISNLQSPISGPHAPTTSPTSSTLQSTLITIILTILALIFIVVLIRRSRMAKTAVPTIIALTFILTPILQITGLTQYEAHRAQAKTLPEVLGLDSEQTSVDNTAPTTNHQAFGQATPSPVCGAGSTATDTDQDNTDDFTEQCLGTDPFNYDTDRDFITDTLEIEGFSYAGRTWYSDPNVPDSNEDGLPDSFEWPTPHGSAPSIDPDNDNIPNLWDDDNDGDGVPDSSDLDPYSVTQYDKTFTLQTTKGDGSFDGYQYIQIQVQPQDTSHLRYTTAALDWPQDEAGTIQDLNHDTASWQDLTFTPMLKITTNNAPDADLAADYGISVVESGSDYLLYIVLNPISDGGQITAFEGQIAYAPDELGDINWEAMELIWMASVMNDRQSGDNITTSSTPLVEYAEDAFRITGLEITKAGTADYAIIGTPNSPNNDRDLFNVLLGLEASFLKSTTADLDEIVNRFSNGSASLTQTWGVPATDIAVYSPTKLGHLNEYYQDTATTIRNFLGDNSYPQDGTMASLLFVLEYDMGWSSLDSLDSINGNSFTFNLSNISVNTSRSLHMSQYAYGSSSWEALDDAGVATAVSSRYPDLSSILNNLQATYPDLTLNDLNTVLYNFYTLYSFTRTAIIYTDGVAVAGPTLDDTAIANRFDLSAITDLTTYLIEALNLANAGGTLVINSPSDLHSYMNNEPDYSFVASVLSALTLDDDLTPQKAQILGQKAFRAISGFTMLFTAKSGVQLGQNGLVWLSYADDASKLAKVGTKLFNWGGLVFTAVGLGVSLFLVWSAFANSHSPYSYQNDQALAVAIAGTVTVVVLAALALTGIGAIFVAAILLADLITWALSAIFGDDFHFMDEIIGGIASVFYDVDAYTQVYDVDFYGLSSDISSGSALVEGATLTLNDTFKGMIQRVAGGVDQLEKSDISGYFAVSAADPSTTAVATSSKNRCQIRYSGYILRCYNSLGAEFTFNQAEINAEVTLLYKIHAKTRYEECTFFVCDDHSDHMTLPDELEDGWNSSTIVMDVLPNTMTKLLNWNELTNHDQDADGLTDAQEAVLGTNPNLWDSDGDGLSDGFELNTQAESGANPLLADTDHDGLSDGKEYQLGTIINDSDSDNDGLTDGQEVFHYDSALGDWTGGGWMIDIDGQSYWVFTDPLVADNDHDTLNDASEMSNGISPNAINDAPNLSMSATPYLTSPTGAEAVFASAGETITANVRLLSSGALPVSTAVNLCLPATLNNINVTPSGDRIPATQQNGDCYQWDFSGNNLQLFEEFNVAVSANASSGTVTDTLTVSLPYQINQTAKPVTVTIPFVQDDDIPTVHITTPISNTLLGGTHYVIGGFANDATSWVDRVDVTVPAGTFTASGTSPWAYTWELPSDGVHTITTVSYDAVGNASSVDSIQVAVDSLAPVITTDFNNGTTISAADTLSTTFHFSGTVSDNYSGLTRIQMRFNQQPWRTIWSDGNNPLNANWSGQWELPVVQSAQGEHNVYLRAYDLAGNVSYLERSIFIDVIPPTNDLTNRTYLSDPPHVQTNDPLTLYGVANDAGNNPLPADPAELTGNLHSISDATIWLQPDYLADNDDGASVTWIGDFNGDRLGDLAVGLPAAADGDGRITIIKGAAGDWPIPNIGDLELLANNRPSFIGETGAGLGGSIKPAGDVNGDGFDDLLIGDLSNNRIFLVYGYASDTGADLLLDDGGGARWGQIYSGNSAETLTDFSMAGDVNNDGLGDILVSVTTPSSGQTYLLLGDVTPLDQLALDFFAAAIIPTTSAGATVAGVGDVDDDFVGDFAVAHSGVVYLFSGNDAWDKSDLMTLSTATAMANFASSDSLPTLAATGDVDGDAIADFAFSSGSTPVVVSGDSNHNFSAQTITGLPANPSRFLTAVGDINADEQGDLLAGTPTGDAYLLLGGNLNSVAATISGVERAASAPYIAGADLAGDGSSDLLLVPNAAAASDLGYDGFGTLTHPFISSSALPGVSTSNNEAPAAPQQILSALAVGDVTVGPTDADYTSIQAAIDSGATRVLIQPGIYEETITLTSNVTVIGSGADRTYLKFPTGVTTTVLVEADGISNTVLMNLTLLGQGSDTGLAVSNGAQNINLSRTIVRDLNTAVSITGNTTDLELKNNTLVGNVNGVNATSCASVDIRNTIFAFNTGTALAYEGCAAVQLHQYNLYWANGTDMSPLDPGGGELFSNPLFLNYANNDYRTATYSPVIDAGSPGDLVPPGAGDFADIGHMEQTGSSFFTDDDYCEACTNDGLIWQVDAFITIQEAVDAAQADLNALLGSHPDIQFTVGVGEGIYTESIVISGTVYLIGSNPDVTTIQGNGDTAVTFQNAVNAGVAGFTLMGGGVNPVGVAVQSSNRINITRNLIKNNDVGIDISQRGSGTAEFNTIISNTTAVSATDQYNWLDLKNNIISGNTNGLVASNNARLFSEHNLLFNTADYSNVVPGVYDITGQDPLLSDPHAYLQEGSPAVDAASPIAPVPTGGGIFADIGWHELLAAPISIFMGQADDSIATESVGVAQVEYAVVSVADPSSAITETLPVSWNTAVLDNPNATLSYWQTNYTPLADGFYRIYSRAIDGVGNIETNIDDWYDGAFMADATAPVVTMTIDTVVNTTDWFNLRAEVYDYANGSFDIEEIYFDINGVKYPARWSLEAWSEEDGAARIFHYFFDDDVPAGSYTIKAVAVDGAGNIGESAPDTVTKSRSTNPWGYYHEDKTLPTILTIDTPASGAFVSGSVTFSGTGGDLYPTGTDNDDDFRSRFSGPDGYELSFDGGATWHVAATTDLDPGPGFPITPSYFFSYTWDVPEGFDATTIPVRIRIADNAGNTQMEIINVTIDTAPPQNISPITFSNEIGYHFDADTPITVTMNQPTDGSATEELVTMMTNDGIGVPWFVITDTTYVHNLAGPGTWYIHNGVQDASGNLTHDVNGPWFMGSVRAEGGFWQNKFQSIYIGDSFDGRLNLTHNEWLTPTELLDDDGRSGQTHSLYATWDGATAFSGWDGGWWENDGTLWLYYDLHNGGLTQLAGGITGTLPIEADYALSIDSPTSGALWTVNGGLWSISQALPVTDTFGVTTFAHDEILGQTEIQLHIGSDTFLLDNHKMLAFTVSDAGNISTAFPTTNGLDPNFEYAYDWNPAVAEELLELPIGAHSPYLAMDFASQPATQNTVAPSDTITYVTTVSNLEGSDSTGLQMSIDGTTGLSYVSVEGATCNTCVANDSWLLDLPTIPSGSSQTVTITAQLDADLSAVETVTTTAQLVSGVPLLQIDSISHRTDDDAPVVSINTLPGNVLNVGSQSFTGTADDGDGSGVAIVEVRPQGGSWQLANGGLAWSGDLNVPAVSSWQLEVRATDHHGQTGPIEQVTFAIDTTPPTVTAVIPALLGGSNSASLTGETADPAPADAQVQHIYIQFDDANNPWHPVTLFSPDISGSQDWLYNWSLPYEDGVTHTLRLRAVDYSDNSATSSWYNTAVDTVSPQINVSHHFNQVEVNDAVPAISGVVTDGTAVASLTILVYPESGAAFQASATLNNGQWSYELDQPLGNYTLYVEAEDSAGNSQVIGSYEVEVVNVVSNYPPIAIDDSETVNKGKSSTMMVLDNDFDVLDDTLTITAVSQGTNGSVTFNGTTATYTHDGSATISDSFTYTISDGNGGSDTAVVTIIIIDNTQYIYLPVIMRGD